MLRSIILLMLITILFLQRRFIYRMDHAVTATQKTILAAFRMDDKAIRKQAKDLADMLEKYDKET